MSEREKYFAVNDKPMGVSTSYRVSGKLGEVAMRFTHHHDAEIDARRLNKAYRLGLRHARERIAGCVARSPLPHAAYLAERIWELKDK